MGIESSPDNRVSRITKGQQAIALGYMVIAVLVFSFIPLAVNLAGGPGAPFLFNFWFRIGAAIGCLLYLAAAQRSIILDKGTLSRIWQRTTKAPTNKLILGTIVSTFDFALLAWSVKHIDITVATILFETWPVFMILFTARLFEGEDRYRKLDFTIISLTLLSLAGFILAIASQTSEVNSVGSFFAVLWQSRVGVGLVAIAIVATTFITSAWKWGISLSNEVAESPRDRSLELGFVVVAFLIASVVSAVGSFGMSVVSSEELAFQGKAMSFAFGVVLTFGNILWGKANFATDNLGINALNYAIPVLSLLLLVWIPQGLTALGLAGVPQAHVERWDYLIMGAAAITTANLIINFEAEIRMGLKSLILALGSCGAFVYLRDDLFGFLNVSQWQWTGGGYFESITLAATVFILLLAFRVSRVVTRASDEDNRTFVVYRKLDMLARRRVINPQVCQYILDLDRAKNNSTVEQEAYNKARQLIEDVDLSNIDTTEAQLLTEAEADLDTLVDSKRVDIHLGEMFALVIFGGITIGLSLLSLPPNVAGWTRLLVDVTAMLVSSVIVYLLFHIQDLQQERDEHNLDSDEPQAGRHLRSFARFLDTENQAFNQWLSIIVGVAIVVTYAVLLGHKWLGWFS